MVVFEILVNGKPLYRVGAGDFGLLTAEVMWARIQQKAGTIFEDFTVHARGMKGAADLQSHWPRTSVKLGDEITIRIVQADSFDTPEKLGH